MCAYMREAATKDKIDLMFRAFSDRTRLRLLNMLRGGERCVCDLVDVLGVHQPKVSRHLAYLRRAGLVVARKDGLWMHYRLADAKTEFHKMLLNCLSCCFQSVPQLRKDAEKLGLTLSACSTNCCE
jgi:ArsR family transcriptional regulator, arsenate/arsenite/antimonite-responsive transcriptional repressor